MKNHYGPYLPLIFKWHFWLIPHY